VEGDLNLVLVSRGFWQAFRALEPFGIGFPPFVFRVCEASIESTRPGRAPGCVKESTGSIWQSTPIPLPECKWGDFLVEITGTGARLVG
jgi:hypothetical protein